MIFLIKLIFLVIINIKPHFKKVHLLIFQFPSLLTWNNDFLAYLIYIFFVIYIYSSSSPLLSSNHFFVSSHLLLPSFFLFFSLTRPHKVEEWRPVAISTCFGSHISWNQAVSVRFSGRNQTISVGISANRRVRCQIPRRDESGAGVTDLEPHPCFLGIC